MLGNNEFGQVGNGVDFVSEALDGSLIVDPIEVVSLDDAIAVSAGGAYSCALRETGEISCWGTNTYGQLGNIQATFSNPTPLPVSGIDDAVVIALVQVTFALSGKADLFPASDQTFTES